MTIKVNPLQRNTEALLKLLGGTDDQRLIYWETLKGITSRQLQSIIELQIETAAMQIQTVQKTLSTLKTNSKQLSQG